MAQSKVVSATAVKHCPPGQESLHTQLDLFSCTEMLCASQIVSVWRLMNCCTLNSLTSWEHCTKSYRRLLCFGCDLCLFLGCVLMRCNQFKHFACMSTLRRRIYALPKERGPSFICFNLHQIVWLLSKFVKFSYQPAPNSFEICFNFMLRNINLHSGTLCNKITSFQPIIASQKIMQIFFLIDTENRFILGKISHRDTSDIIWIPNRI